ncbi:protein-L-isoaspartate(D-aspartate) O-methyltransferase [Antarcticibacterium arcticum]|uniref:Protein-L-isoaspartate O-methyltransferase n=1 Tax=Antarcticibacterium arcticum TaxID=2585771 RepID=A0A5B8YI28_9FLAO|nr:protein-L-isoaspartate(D-aspartate) O-methyltransferase [Antarcticibacterium arcticum]QED37592.1 protein-L-isoaspartate(D-aspartate) O-methyltransferase [Antarcticibacterium arcticum]
MMKLSLLISVVILLLSVFPAQQDKYYRERQLMVKTQLESRGIVHKPTLKAMRSVKRHLLVPRDQEKNAYEDRPLPIGYGQTISQPYMVGYMTEVIRPKKGMKVLEIGTGSGYQAAVLGEIVDEVYTIEIIEQLAKTSRSRLGDMGYTNIHVKEGDGYFGWEEHAPFDAIVVTAASAFIPPPLIEQLKEGGKMVIPVGAPFTTQQLMLVEKQKGGKRTTRNLLPVRFVPFTRN